MFRPRFTHHHVTSADPSWFAAPIAYPARSSFDFEDLAGFVGVPVGAGGGGKLLVVRGVRRRVGMETGDDEERTYENMVQHDFVGVGRGCCVGTGFRG
jgi:hypothetical protein